MLPRISFDLYYIMWSSVIHIISLFTSSVSYIMTNVNFHVAANSYKQYSIVDEAQA